MQNTIHEYVRERVTGKGKQIVGIIVGTVIDGMICTGWAKCNLKEGDVFSKEEGISIAINRAYDSIPTPELPIQMRNQMREFQIRCIRYFKQADTLSTKGPYVGMNAEKNQQVDDTLSLIKNVMSQLGLNEMDTSGFGICGATTPEELEMFKDLLGA
jgi:hypothetical protein